MNIQQTIRKIIDGVKTHLADFEVRDSQLQFMDAITDICENKDSPNNIIAELPTGTGKSLGSLIPALAYTQVTNEKRSKDDTIKICYSTATISLQKQLLRDVELLRASGVDFKAHIVVGRGRFICKRNALALMRPDSEQANLLTEQNNGDKNNDVGLPPPESTTISEVEKTKVKKAIYQLKDDEWTGIVDDLDRELTMEDRTWRRVRADANTCNRQCQYWGSGCPFVKNRMDTESADVIITNHAMVFADLEKSAILPAPERTLHILDEAHHLVDNFHGTMERKMSFSAIYDTCTRQLGAISTGIAMGSEIADIKNHEHEVNQRLVRVRDALLPFMQFLDDRYHQYAETLPMSERDKAIWRLDTNYITQSGMLDSMHVIYDDLVVVRQKMASVIEEINAADKELNIDEAQVIGQLGVHHNNIDSSCTLLTMYLNAKDTDAFWYKRHQAKGSASATLFGAKVNVSEDMKALFWERIHKSIAMSATLSNDGAFSSFNHESGLAQPSACEYRFNSPFTEAFQYSSLHLYPDFPEPDWRNETAHSQSIVDELIRFMSYHRAGLQLFVSKRPMNEVVSLLPPALRESTLVQGVDGARSQIIETHRKKIDKGELSLLIGLASFSEGLDLKKHYLTFVGIAKLSFGSFNEPRKITESENLQASGGNPFMQLTLPCAEKALQQSVGRLIRSIECRGEVAIFDRRILTKRYGAGLLERLPPFYREFHTRQQRYG